MKVLRKNAKIIKNAIYMWHEEKIISDKVADDLANSIETWPFDWRRLSKYSFWCAIACLLISFFTVIYDDKLMTMLAQIFNASDVIKSIFSCLTSVTFYYLGFVRKKIPSRVLSSEVLFFLGGLFTAISIYYIDPVLNLEIRNSLYFALTLSAVYIPISIIFTSNIVWFFSISCFSLWLGFGTMYFGSGVYGYNMSDPLRTFIFGLFLAFLSYAMLFIPRLSNLFKITKIMGLTFIFLSLLLLSIWGNFETKLEWQKAGQLDFLPWILLFASASIASIWHGLRYDDGLTKSFGLTFLFINLYTRFFELFWNSLHISVFFAILAFSLWLLGTKAESIWSLNFYKERK